jgi:hypothetical protein
VDCLWGYYDHKNNIFLAEIANRLEGPSEGFEPSSSGFRIL